MHRHEPSILAHLRRPGPLAVLAVALGTTGCLDPDAPNDDLQDYAADEERQDPDDWTVAEDVEPEADPLPEMVGMEMIDIDGDGVLGEFDELVALDEPQAIGELACATASIANSTHGGSTSMSPTPNCGINTDSRTSPNTSYNPAGCPHQYITEVTGTSQRPLSFFWNWQGATLNANTCALAHANLSAYGAYLTWPLGVAWAKLGTTSVHGQWINTPWFGYCSWQYDAGSGPIPSLGSHFFFKVRTAVQATGFIFKQQVEGGISHGPGPC